VAGTKTNESRFLGWPPHPALSRKGRGVKKIRLGEFVVAGTKTKMWRRKTAYNSGKGLKNKDCVCITFELGQITRAEIVCNQKSAKSISTETGSLN
jgi:hypothetical protein